MMFSTDVGVLKSEVAKIDLSPHTHKLNSTEYGRYLTQEAGEHYRLLAYISSVCSGETIYEVGTHFGASLIALSFNPSVNLFSYDIQYLLKIDKIPRNVTFCIGDFRNNPHILSAPFIFIDVDPHDGVQERNFHQFFLDNGYRGRVLWDDIHLNDKMQSWWDGVTNEKHDLTEVGHATGTGLIVYG
jgi:hypothetical protein